MSSNTQSWDDISIPNSGSSQKLPFDSARGTERIEFFDWAPVVTQLDLLTAIPNAIYQIFEVSGTNRSPPRGETDHPSDTEFETRRSRIIAAVRRLKDSAPNWSGVSTKVDAGSALTAERFLFCLPSTVALPKVAPDGEGDVMFVWDEPGKQCIVVAEPKLLHLVSKPGDPTGVQISAQRFLGIQIPPSILRHLPAK
jgi:hypothetical protein